VPLPTDQFGTGVTLELVEGIDTVVYRLWALLVPPIDALSPDAKFFTLTLLVPRVTISLTRLKCYRTPSPFESE